MSFTQEQKIELNRLNDQYDRIGKLSGIAGMNPDKLINEFNFKFMDVTELNRQQLDALNEDRQTAFQNNHFRIHKSGL